MIDLIKLRSDFEKLIETVGIEQIDEWLKYDKDRLYTNSKSFFTPSQSTTIITPISFQKMLNRTP